MLRLFSFLPRLINFVKAVGSISDRHVPLLEQILSISTFPSPPDSRGYLITSIGLCLNSYLHTGAPPRVRGNRLEPVSVVSRSGGRHTFPLEVPLGLALEFAAAHLSPAAAGKVGLFPRPHF
jgi:hypothetical protein